MTEEELEPTYLEKPYTQLLFKGIMSSYQKWVEGRVEAALRELLILVVHLPTDIKEKLWPEKKKIEEDLRKAYEVAGVDWYTRQQNRNRSARRVASFYIEPFMDQMVRLLDEKRWLERGALKARYKTEAKLTA